MDTSYSDNITFGDLSRRSIRGKGKILLRHNNVKELYILDIYFIPNMKYNILSLGQLLEKFYDIKIKDMTLYNKNKALIPHIKMDKNRIFPLYLCITD